MSNYTNTTVIVDFMSVLRKVAVNKFGCRDALECMWNMITKVPEANLIDVVFDSYIENYIIELTRASRSNDVEPTEYVNLLLKSHPPVALKRFWASSTNKSCRFYHLNFLNRKSKKRTLL